MHIQSWQAALVGGNTRGQAWSFDLLGFAFWLQGFLTFHGLHRVVALDQIERGLVLSLVLDMQRPLTVPRTSLPNLLLQVLERLLLDGLQLVG